MTPIRTTDNNTINHLFTIYYSNDRLRDVQCNPNGLYTIKVEVWKQEANLFSQVTGA